MLRLLAAVLLVGAGVFVGATLTPTPEPASSADSDEGAAFTAWKAACDLIEDDDEALACFRSAELAPPAGPTITVDPAGTFTVAGMSDSTPAVQVERPGHGPVIVLAGDEYARLTAPWWEKAFQTIVGWWVPTDEAG